MSGCHADRAVTAHRGVVQILQTKAPGDTELANSNLSAFISFQRCVLKATLHFLVFSICFNTRQSLCSCSFSFFFICRSCSGHSSGFFTVMFTVSFWKHRQKDCFQRRHFNPETRQKHSESFKFSAAFTSGRSRMAHSSH